ncbi:hypothetical protein RI129_009655 [Pyrocoelia pectoralis]|uniref:Peptidase S1 domain-containing protein n=1 Tax=Pyrocoelia pectoralis TaxID=417401 RepID=A0AAN7ZJ54_9COLE
MMAYLIAILSLSIIASVTAILDSEVVEKHSIPYQADLIIDFPDSETLYRTGTLISSNYVLTAANCVVGSSNITVVMGVYNVEVKDEPTRRTYTGVSYTASPLYNGNKGRDDIAVIRLNRPSEINEYIQLAKLPRYSDKYTSLIGKVARVSGWGNVDSNSDLEHSILRYANITIRDHSECQPQFQQTSIGQLCSTHTDKLFEVSDIGAPLVLGKVQIGIAAVTNIVNGKEQSPQIYTRIGRYLRWLDDTTDANIKE